MSDYRQYFHYRLSSNRGALSGILHEAPCYVGNEHVLERMDVLEHIQF